jgi:outer membrane protein OmpA-like peptidoglycan-associated protein
MVAFCACAARAPHRPMQLQRVILYENGIGYFERAGHVGGDTVELRLARGELDDVLKTLTVIDRLGAGVATVDVPTTTEHDRTIALGVRLAAGRVHDVRVSYAVPTPTWKAAYRVVLDEGAHGLLQGWAMVNNASQEDWNGVQLTLATGAPMSFALDLHTPRYASRPDATGHLVAPTVLGPIDDEKVASLDRDGDGIPDVEDKCPDEPETINGFQDMDGCPDRGRVVVTSTSLQVLDLIHFAKGSDAIAPESRTILDAVAATLRDNSEITRLEIGGHASPDEEDGWSLSARRAGAVRGALIARGVDAARLVIQSYGSTRPLDKRGEKDRRVEFLILDRAKPSDPPSRRAPPPLDTNAMAGAVHTATRPADVAGAVRYALTEPVSIRRGASAMVSILNQKIGAEDAFLFRPDGNAPGSDRHPFRAVRLANDSGFTLEPGPIAIFARGTFVGDSLIHRLDIGETAWIPYALDGGTQVTVASDQSERPVRIAAIHRGVATVEAYGVHVTRYTIAAGREPARTLYIRHVKRPHATAKDLPPGTQDRGDDYLVPVPLQAGKTSVLAIEEREPVRRTIELLDANATQLGLYVEGSHLPQQVAERIATAIAARGELGKLEDEIEAQRERVGDLASRAEELRENLKALDKVRGADDLRKKLVADLAVATADSDAIQRQLGGKTEAQATARGKLQDALRELSLDERKEP